MEPLSLCLPLFSVQITDALLMLPLLAANVFDVRLSCYFIFTEQDPEGFAVDVELAKSPFTSGC